MSHYTLSVTSHKLSAVYVSDLCETLCHSAQVLAAVWNVFQAHTELITAAIIFVTLEANAVTESAVNAWWDEVLRFSEDDCSNQESHHFIWHEHECKDETQHLMAHCNQVWLHSQCKKEFLADHLIFFSWREQQMWMQWWDWQEDFWIREHCSLVVSEHIHAQSSDRTVIQNILTKL